LREKSWFLQGEHSRRGELEHKLEETRWELAWAHNKVASSRGLAAQDEKAQQEAANAAVMAAQDTKVAEATKQEVAMDATEAVKAVNDLDEPDHSTWGNR
jgi:hypothetical protein